MASPNPEAALYTPTKWRRIRAMRLAKVRHRWLIAVLGNACALCGNGWDEVPLEIDHIDGRERANHSAHTRGQRWDVRVREYIKEFYQGVRLRVLCKVCNSTDGRRRQLEAEALVRELPDAPF